MWVCWVSSRVMRVYLPIMNTEMRQSLKYEGEGGTWGICWYFSFENPTNDSYNYLKVHEWKWKAKNEVLWEDTCFKNYF